MRIPFRHQIDDARLIHLYGGRALLSSEMGLGKSLSALLYAHRHPELRPVLVVCPASLKWQWRREATIGIGERAEILEGAKPEPNRGLGFKPPITIINYDVLSPWMDQLLEMEPKLLIVDEAQYLCSQKSLRSRCVRRLSQAASHMIALSGTPLTNKPAELWHILHCLRPDLFPEFVSFGFRYAPPTKVFGRWVYSGAANLDHLHHLLTARKNVKKRVMIRRRKQDVLKDLPKKRRIVVEMDLSDPEEYRHAEADFMGWLEKNAPEKMESAARGAAFVKVGYLRRLAASLKVKNVFEWVDNFLDGSEGKIILFAVHKTIIAKLHERYKRQSVVVDGSVTGRHRQLAVEKFQKDPKCRVFIGNIKAAGVGLNLTAAHTVAFVEMGWTPAEHSQAEDRAFARLGDLHGVEVFYLIGRETVEHHICKLIRRKQKILTAVLDGGVSKPGDDFNVFDLVLERLMKKRPPGR